MNWKTFLLQTVIASLSGASQLATGVIGQAQDPTQKVNWKAVGNAALIGALLGTIAHWGQQGVQLGLAAVAQPAPQSSPLSSAS